MYNYKKMSIVNLFFDIEFFKYFSEFYMKSVARGQNYSVYFNYTLYIYM
jgi:hypothetical protein